MDITTPHYKGREGWTLPQQIQLLAGYSLIISPLITTTNLIMTCYVCNIPLIWGGDHDIDEEEELEHKIMTNLSCQKCGSIVYVYHGN